MEDSLDQGTFIPLSHFRDAKGTKFEEAYKVPKKEFFPSKSIDLGHAALKSKGKKKTYVDYQCEANKFVPSPDKYHHENVWCSPKSDGACRPKGKFLGQPRVSIIDEWARTTKDRIAPSKYNPLKAFNYQQGKTPGTYDNKETDMNFVDGCIANKVFVPAPNKYPPVDLDLIKNKRPDWKINAKSGLGYRCTKLKKDDLKIHDPGSYNTRDSFLRTSGSP